MDVLNNQVVSISTVTPTLSAVFHNGVKKNFFSLKYLKIARVMAKIIMTENPKAVAGISY